MHVVVCAYGTMGNVLPFIGWGRALKARGHRVTLVGNKELIRFSSREGFELLTIKEPPLVQRSLSQIRTSGVRQRLGYLRSAYEMVLRGYCEALVTIIPQQDLVVAAPFWIAGARIACEIHQVPLATVYLQPAMLPSDPQDMTRGRWQRALHRFRRKALYAIANPVMASKLNLYRSELGLPAVAKPLQWWNSSDAILAFFPEWFSPRHGETPAQLEYVGFPLFDTWDSDWRSEELDLFLASGEPPLVFSQSTNAREDRNFISVSIEAAARLHRRAVILTTLPEQLPDPLPDHVRYFGFVPLSAVLPRAAAFIHHGGMGSLSQAIAARVPQLTMPQILDQPNNCHWLGQLGVSRQISVREYRVDRVTEELRFLLISEKVRQRCSELAELLPIDDPYGAACDSMERLAARRGP